jgi:pilus assembly protein Flp/PilA
MFQFVKLLSSLRRETRGVTALEYGLIAAVMGGLVITAITTFGTDMGTAMTGIGNVIESSATNM